MAGSTLQITVDDEAARALLRRLVDFGADAMKDAGRDVGEYLLRVTRERGAAERSPDGVPWVALTDRYAARKQRKRGGLPMLHYDGHLLGDRLQYQVGRDWVEIGTDAVYGAIHQFGGKPDMAPGPAAIPARPWLGLSDEDTKEVARILQDHLDIALDGR